VEQPFELVSENGAPRGEKFFLFVNPPVVNQQLGIRRSYLVHHRLSRIDRKLGGPCPSTIAQGIPSGVEG
jgi:hypothetical protein